MNRIYSFSLKFLLLPTLLILSAGCTGADIKKFVPGNQHSSIVVHFSGLKNTGTVFVALYQSAEEFEKKRGFVSSAIRKPDGDKMTIIFTGLFSPGDYAVAAFHDENGDKKLNFYEESGIPSEGFAFSNNPRLDLGPASWERTSFHVEEERKEVQIRMAYP